MMKAVLKTLALSFGGGLALGAGIRLTQGPAKSRRRELGAEGVDLDPLLARLKNVESRVVDMESVRVKPAPVPPIPSDIPEKLAVFESRLAGQITDLERLRGQVRRADERLIQLDSQLPVIVQSTVDVRFQEAERKLQHEFEEAQSRSMSAFVETLQTKVVERISTLEANLAEQSQAIGKLRDTSLRSDENLQKMLAGIERLVDQSRIPPPPAPAAAPHDELPAAIHVAFQREEPEMPRQENREDAAEIPEAVPAVIAVEYDAVRYIQPPPQAVLPAEHRSTPLAAAPVLAEVAEEIPVPAGAAGRGPGIEPEIVPEMSRAGALEVVPTSRSVSEAPLRALPEVVAASTPEESYEWVNKIGIELLAPRAKPRLGWRIPLVVGLVAGLILIAGLLYTGMLQHYFESSVAAQTSTLASTAPADPSPAPQNSNDLAGLEQRAASHPHDPAVLMDLGREYQRRKEWSKAEGAYRSVLQANHANRDAAVGLSDVLYQEQRYEESAAALNLAKAQ